MSLIKTFLKKNYIGSLLLFLFVTIAIFSFEDYGIAWDEPAQRNIGLVNMAYILGSNDRLMTFVDNDHGSGFEITLVLFERIFKLNESSTIYSFRHLISHLLFLMGCFCFFLLINNLFNNQILAAFGFLILVLHPVIYGHSFFNSKDIPLLSMLLICLLFAQLAFTNKEKKYFFMLGFLCAFVVNIRILGIIFPLIILFLLFTDYFLAELDKKKSQIQFVLVFSITFIFSLYLTWPYLWPNPIGNFILVFQKMANYNRNELMLFNGSFISWKNPPWYYIPTWVFITTPIIYITLFFIGLSITGKKFISYIIQNIQIRHWDIRILRSVNKKLTISAFIVLFGSLFMIIVLKSTLYDSWRHMFFIYPFIVFFIIIALNFIFNYSKYGRIIFIIVFSLYLGTIAIHIISYYPNYHVYFNELQTRKSQELRKKWELDYWAVSGKQALEYIANNDTSLNIKISFVGMHRHNLLMLNQNDRARIEIDPKNAKYLITNYRGHPDDFPYENWYSINVLNNSVISIYKLN